jgi:hypothetical protein
VSPVAEGVDRAIFQAWYSCQNSSARMMIILHDDKVYMMMNMGDEGQKGFFIVYM